MKNYFPYIAPEVQILIWFIFTLILKYGTDFAFDKWKKKGYALYLLLTLSA